MAARGVELAVKVHAVLALVDLSTVPIAPPTIGEVRLDDDPARKHHSLVAQRMPLRKYRAGTDVRAVEAGGIEVGVRHLALSQVRLQPRPQQLTPKRAALRNGARAEAVAADQGAPVRSVGVRARHPRALKVLTLQGHLRSGLLGPKNALDEHRRVIHLQGARQQRVEGIQQESVHRQAQATVKDLHSEHSAVQQERQASAVGRDCLELLLREGRLRRCKCGLEPRHLQLHKSDAVALTKIAIEDGLVERVQGEDKDLRKRMVEQH